MSSKLTNLDVVIVGAGLAGAVAAHVLAEQRLKVTLVDAATEYPACFKAEKIEPEQVSAFRDLGLMETLDPHAARVHEILVASAGRIVHPIQVEQYGIFYHDMVNAVRRGLPQ